MLIFEPVKNFFSSDFVEGINPIYQGNVVQLLINKLAKGIRALQ